MLKIWSFKTHYMIKCEIGDMSYGWRVNMPIHEDKELSERIGRLKNKIEGMVKC